MICHFKQRINIPGKLFWDIPLDELYTKLAGLVRARQNRFYLPSSERYSEADGYILWGHYIRKRIIDIQHVQQEDGSWDYKEVVIEEFQIQRIRDTMTGETHAILNETMTPYKQYTLRYILFHLSKFFEERVSQEEYCLEHDIHTKTLSQWLKWMKDNSSLLFGLGLTKSYEDNWQAMRLWIQDITGDVFVWTYNSLKKLNLALFQERKMPENTVYRNYDSPG